MIRFVGGFARDPNNPFPIKRKVESRELPLPKPEIIAIILLTVISLALCFTTLMLSLENIYLRNIDEHKALTISRQKRDQVYSNRVMVNVVQVLNRAGGL